MFLYPLLGGALYLYILQFKIKINRFFINIHNSGIATLTIASFLQGVFEIAGTNSAFLIYYKYIGFLFIIYGFIYLCLLTKKNKY